jgi:hypothetical protein
LKQKKKNESSKTRWRERRKIFDTERSLRSESRKTETAREREGGKAETRRRKKERKRRIE